MKKRIDKKFTVGFLTLATLCLVGAATSGTALNQVKADSATCSFSAKSKYMEFGWDAKLGSRKIGLNKLKEVTCPDGSMISFTSAGLETVSEKETPVIQTGSNFSLSSTNITSFSMYFGNDTTSSTSVTTLPITSVTATGKDGSGNITIDKPITFNDNIAILKITEEQLSTLKIGDINEISFSLEPPKVNDNYTLSFDTISFSYVEDKPTPTEESLTITGTLDITEYYSDQEWSTKGLTVMYDDGSGEAKEIEDHNKLDWTPNPLSPGKVKDFDKSVPLTISCSYQTGKSQVYSNQIETSVIVHKAVKVVDHVEITGSMTNKDYTPTSASWDKTGLVVTAYYEDESHEQIDPTSSELTWNFDPATPAEAQIGQNTLKIHVTYEEHTSPRNKQIVYVKQQTSRPVVHTMKWLVDQYKPTWQVGDTYDESALRVVNENDEEITDYAVFSFDKTIAQITDKSVTVTVNYINEDKSIVVTPLVKTFKVTVNQNDKLVLSSITVSGKPNVVDFSRSISYMWDFTGMTASGKDADNNTYEHVELLEGFEWKIGSSDPESPSAVLSPTDHVTLHVSGSIGGKVVVTSEPIEVDVYIYDGETPPMTLVSYTMEGDFPDKHFYSGQEFSSNNFNVIGINNHGSQYGLKIEDPSAFSFNPATPEEAAAKGGNVTVTCTIPDAGGETVSTVVSGIIYHDEEAYELTVEGTMHKTTYTKGDDASFSTDGLTLVKRREDKDDEPIVSTPEDPITVRFSPFLTPDEADVGEGTLYVEFEYRGETAQTYSDINVIDNPTVARYTITGDFGRKVYYVGEEWDYGNVRINYYEAGMTTPSRTWTAKEALEKTSVEGDAWNFSVSPERATYTCGSVSMAITDTVLGLQSEALVIYDISVNQTANFQNYIQTSKEMQEFNYKITAPIKETALLDLKLAVECDAGDTEAYVWDGSTTGAYTETTRTKTTPSSLADMPTAWIEFGLIDPLIPEEFYAQVFTGTIDNKTSKGYITCAGVEEEEAIALSNDPAPVQVGFDDTGSLALTVTKEGEGGKESIWTLTFALTKNDTKGKFCFSKVGGSVNIYALGKDYQRTIASDDLVNRCMGANNMLTTMCGTGYVSEEDWNEMYETYFEDFELTGSDLIVMQQGVAKHVEDPEQKVYIQEFLAKYDYIVNKYGYNAFIEGRDVSPSPKINTINNTVYIVISIVAVMSLAGFATIVVVKKKKGSVK